MNSVRIPGKVMLSGEYAVLYGGTAVLLPLRRYLHIYRAEQRMNRAYPPVVRAALEIEVPAVADHEFNAGVPHLEIDRGELMGEDSNGRPVKLGLGGSAAEAVGTIALRYESAGLPWIQHWYEIAKLAHRAHREAQEGLGSGADIAACAYRRPLCFRRDGSSFTTEAIPVPNDEDVPPLTLLWTGQPADTRTMVRRFDDWRQASAGNDGLVTSLRDHADELAPLWFKGDNAALLEALDGFEAVLHECCGKAGVAYQLPLHARLAAWAKRHGGRAKPTGAGGGDMILMVGELPLDQLAGQMLIPLDPATVWG